MNVSYPKVSIVIPVYNGADFLSEAIDSALAQTYSNVEVLVVNDGSADDGATEQIARAYGDKIRYLSKPNGGVASALNLGIREMKGDYFSWLSHDDLYTPHKVEAEVDLLLKQSDSRSIVYSDYRIFSDLEQPDYPISLRGVAPEDFRYWITVENSLHGCTLIIPRIAFEECGLFDERLRTTQDYDLWFRMARKFRFVHMPEKLVRARQHAAQGTRQMAGLALAECDRLLTGFIANLDVAEVVSGSRLSPAAGYAQIASSMWARGFRKAGRHATRLSLAGFATASMPEKLAVISRLLRGKALSSTYNVARNLAHRMIPVKVKEALRPRPMPVLAPTDAVRDLELREKFSQVYEKNIFGGSVSRSGAGSDLLQTEIIRREIPRLLRQYGVKTLIDAPCGDWYWMREVDLEVERYIGLDIVPALIEANNKTYGRENVVFRCADLARDHLPEAADMIFSRDCLVHLSFEDALNILKNFKASGAKYLLTTTFTDRMENEDLGSGFWRPLNKQIAPFNFPPPLELINEGCTEGDNKFRDKSLGLWKLEDIPLE